MMDPQSRTPQLPFGVPKNPPVVDSSSREKWVRGFQSGLQNLESRTCNFAQGAAVGRVNTSEERGQPKPSAGCITFGPFGRSIWESDITVVPGTFQQPHAIVHVQFLIPLSLLFQGHTIYTPGLQRRQRYAGTSTTQTYFLMRA